jgi:hypothetical protein
MSSWKTLVLTVTMALSTSVGSALAQEIARGWLFAPVNKPTARIVATSA